jgi:hypothetical protein
MTHYHNYIEDDYLYRETVFPDEHGRSITLILTLKLTDARLSSRVALKSGAGNVERSGKEHFSVTEGWTTGRG